MKSSVSTLRYRILDGPVSLEPLKVLQTQCIAWGVWDVSFSVLGASHAVTLSCPDAEFAEVLACACPDGPISAVVDVPGAIPSQPLALVHGVQVRCRIDRFTLADGDDLSFRVPPDSRLDRPFPPVDGHIPFTRIGWRIDGSALMVETVHTYPEDNAGVRTNTEFSMATAKQAGPFAPARPEEDVHR